MKRTLDQAMEALRNQVKTWANRVAQPELRVFVYPPEWEPLMLARLAELAEQCAQQGEPVAVEDVGQGFLRELEVRDGLIERLTQLERADLLHDLGWVGASYLKRTIRQPLPGREVCRILVNTGSLGSFVSYSAVANEVGAGGEPELPPTVLAFPGEADERSLNLLGLRADSNYRVPRI